MNKYNDVDDNRDNYINEDEEDIDNSAAGSGSDGPIFDPIKMPRSRLSLAEGDRKMAALWPLHTM